ncbi:hypothetical protein G9C98_006300 [Cotesia typhae]|uniref:SOWAHA-C winged helix-turn-helix domain-containing protein n=1 Tax=Cotesia typhae TaxID=2053667 RepID=A0A8J5QZQ1_9HYME|nr:hypothetical protein G9C98_006300 [Cotesia typhae]
MATPSNLSLDEIRKYLIESGGSARNRDLVKHFKYFLTDPETRVTSYPYVSSSTLLESPDFLTPTSPLRDPPPYRPPPPAPLSPSNSDFIPSSSPSSYVSSTRATQDELYLKSPSTHSDFNSSTPNLNITIESSANYPSNQIFGSITNSYNFVTTNQQSQQNISEINTDYTSPINSPPVPPRRKSQDKFKLDNKDNKENISNKGKNQQENIKEDEGPPESLGTSELPSVRERMQRFNRMASETDLHGRPNSATTPAKKRSDKITLVGVSLPNAESPTESFPVTDRIVVAMSRITAKRITQLSTTDYDASLELPGRPTENECANAH